MYVCVCLEFNRLNICFAVSGHCIYWIYCVFRFWYRFQCPICLWADAIAASPLGCLHDERMFVCVRSCVWTNVHSFYFCCLFVYVYQCLCVYSSDEYDFKFIYTCNINIKYPFWWVKGHTHTPIHATITAMYKRYRAEITHTHKHKQTNAS